MSHFKFIQVTENHLVAQVGLNRPERHNAFHPEMIAELTQLFLQLDKRKDLLAVVLHGFGKSFSAGGDLEWMKSMAKFSYEENLHDARLLFDMFQAISSCSLPLIGFVHGKVLGGGMGLISVCDFVAAEEKTSFGFTEVKLGLAPAVISPFVLKKARPQVKDFMLTAQIFDAIIAQQLGLIQFIGNPTQCFEYLSQTLTQLWSLSPEAVRETKRLLQHLSNPSSPIEQRETSTTVLAQRRVSPEGQEGLSAFLQQRPPRWNHLQTSENKKFPKEFFISLWQEWMELKTNDSNKEFSKGLP
ncbi:MAG: enoyl-CoA hydratase/isomerase family protein [Bdellovibrionales bacterium]|nr:enoyl-CoA hydratase/isomerase family protein [Bdellovibrionales bacterium]